MINVSHCKHIPHFYIYLWLITCLHIYHVSPWQQSFLNRPWRGHVHCQPYGFWNMNHNLWTDTKWYKYKWIWWEKINNMAVIYHEHNTSRQNIHTQLVRSSAFHSACLMFCRNKIKYGLHNLHLEWNRIVSLTTLWKNTFICLFDGV